MKTVSPTLIEVISPPPNPWLQTLLKGRAGDIPPWVHVVRFDDKDEYEATLAASRSGKSHR